jgi:hypothetical protein
MMLACEKPFEYALLQDPMFFSLRAERIDEFWEYHSQNQQPGFFSEQFKDLISSMLHHNAH